MKVLEDENTKQQPVQKRSLFTGVAACVAIAIPAILFYTVLFRGDADIPCYECYGGLDFLNRLKQLPDFSHKLAFLLSSQFFEYKLLFAEALAWLQMDVSGQVHFTILSAVSNSFVLFLAILLWKMFLPNQKDLSLRLALFVPIPWLLFQLEYYELLNRGGAGLQHITSTAFAFATIHLLYRRTRLAFIAAAVFAVLAVFSSGTGFLLLPIGTIILISGRNYKRILTWFLVFALSMTVYFFNYNVMSSQASPDHSVVSALLRLRPIYIVSFIGSAAGVPFPPVSFALGISLLAFFSWMALRGYPSKNPEVTCCVLFVFLTAAGAAAIRSDLGLEQSVASRYTMFSILLVILAWFAVAEEFVQHRPVTLPNNGVYLGTVAFAVIFSLSMDAIGIQMIYFWRNLTLEGMYKFEHPISPGSTDGPGIEKWNYGVQGKAFNPHARAILIESMKLGVYEPPKY